MSLRRPCRRRGRGGAGGSGQVRGRYSQPPQPDRRPRWRPVQGWRRHHGAGMEGGLPRLGAGGVERRCRARAMGGQDLPHALNAACIEMWNSAAMAFGLGPVLTMAAVDALVAHGSDELKRAYLPKLVSGEWMGTMQLTEPQAGSDVGALRTKAERAADGSYRITGQKIFITY